MEYSLLTETFDELLERIDQYFDWELIQEPRARANLEIYKEELIHELQIELWVNHSRPVYANYDPAKFIWLKAKKVWIAFIRRLPKQRSNLEISNLPENFASSSFLQDFESRDTVAIIESLLSESEIELLRQRGQGIPYKEIPNYPSAAAAKTKFHGIKKFIRIRFGRP